METERYTVRVRQDPLHEEWVVAYVEIDAVVHPIATIATRVVVKNPNILTEWANLIGRMLIETMTRELAANGCKNITSQIDIIKLHEMN